MQILELTGCHQYHGTIKNEFISCSLFCFVFLGQAKKFLKNHPNFHSLHSNSTFNSNRIKIILLYVDIQPMRKIKLTSCGLGYCLANKIPKCGEKIFQSTELEIGSAKYETWSWLLVAGWDLTAQPSESLSLTLLEDQVGLHVRELLVKHRVLFKGNMLYGKLERGHMSLKGTT